MTRQDLLSPALRILPHKREPAPVKLRSTAFAEGDPLQSIRDYRLRKVATKRIPSRIS
jgi:hypothetical protein